MSAGLAYDPNRQFPIDFELTENAMPYKLRAVESKVEMSEISDAPYVDLRHQAIEMTVPMYNELRVKAAVAPPLYYIVPAQWQEVIEVLEAHGLKLLTTSAPATIDIESYRFHDVKWPAGPFEGRQMPSFRSELVREERTFPAWLGGCSARAELSQSRD